MRPTLSLAEWKIAVDLEKTRSIQRSPSMLATNCECEHCQNWRMVVHRVLPDKIVHQLGRIGISSHFPSDSYSYGPQNETEDFRVWFYAVGKILSGPSGWTEKLIGGEMTKMRNYAVLRQEPFLSLVVQRGREFIDPIPDFENVDYDDIVQIDFRLRIPWLVD